MSLAPYLPTACYACRRTWLAPPAFESASSCQFCHGLTQVIPGESYRADDIPTFDRIERAIAASQPSDSVTYQQWVTLSNVPERWRRPEELVLAAREAFPDLRFLNEGFANDRAELARAVGMILAVLTTLLRSVEARRQPSSAMSPPSH